jgi:hypothetical protein
MAVEPVVHDLRHSGCLCCSAANERDLQAHYLETSSKEARHQRGGRPARKCQVKECCCAEGLETISHAIH